MIKRFGISRGVSPREDLKSVGESARICEENGFEVLWFIDHQLGMKDVYAAMNVAALNTAKIEIGSAVTNLVTRHPTVTANATTALDELSDIEDTLHRIDTFNPVLNAFLGRVDELARKQAAEAEQAYAMGDARALSGVPVSVKDTFHLTGSVTTFGSLAYRANVSHHNSGVVKRLRAAGTVITGKTNTSEFAQSATTENLFADDCHNPWDISRTSGGSSGGAAASVAAGLSSMAVGADGGGSIRIPAAFTGVFGLKPTYGLCHDENGLNAMSDFISPGPLTRRVADARMLLSVLAETAYPRLWGCALPGVRVRETARTTRR